MTHQVIPEGLYVDVGDGHRLHYHDIGEGKPLIFLHGSGPGASGWSNFHGNAERLAQRGFRCILPDILGYGYSSKPTDVDYGFERLGGGIRRLAEAIGIADEPVALVGNSMGGALAIHLALEHPDWVGRLVLMAPGGLEEREVYMQMRGIRRMLRCLYGPEGLTREGIAKVFELQLHGMEVSDAVLDQRYTLATQQPLHVFKTLRVPHLAPRLSELRMPVLGLWGVEDQFCPVSGAMTLAKAVEDCHVTLLSGCGHWVMVERPEVFDRHCSQFLGG